MSRRNVVIMVSAILASLLFCCCAATALLYTVGRNGSSSSTEEATGEVDLIELQLALEKAIWTHQLASSFTAQVLAANADSTDQAEWEEAYEASLGAWKDAEDAAKDLEKLSKRLPDYEDPTASRATQEDSAFAHCSFGVEQAYAAENPMDLSDFKSAPDGEVSLDITNEAREVIRGNAKKAAIVQTYNEAPPGEKIKSVAKFMETDATSAQKFMEDNFSSLSKSYKDVDAYYEKAVKVATAIDGAADVSLFVLDTATGPGKVSLAKAVTKAMMKRLLKPQRLAKSVALSWKRKSFTTAVSGADLLLGLYNKGVVIATGDDAAGFSVSGDVASGMSLLLTLNSLRGQAGLLKNAAELATSPSNWKAAWGWGSLAGKLMQTGVNGVSVDASGEEMKIEPAPVSFAEYTAAQDISLLAAQESMLAVDEIAAAEAAYTTAEKADTETPEGGSTEEELTGLAALAGEYEGSTLVGLSTSGRVAIPTAMRVNDDGTFTASMSYSGSASEWGVDWMSSMTWKAQFTGTVTEEGVVSGSGTRTTITIATDGNSPDPLTTGATISGSISGDTFKGVVKAESWMGQAMDVSLER